jgi:hypothetical protein
MSDKGTLWDHVRKLFDRDYSPAYQDEYQRLWHQSAADAERLRNLAGALLQRQTARGTRRTAQQTARGQASMGAARHLARRLLEPRESGRAR